MTLLLVTYVVPLAALGVTYTVVGIELWGSKAIGERTPGQDESAKSKRRASNQTMKLRGVVECCILNTSVTKLRDTEADMKLFMIYL